jgi:ADP-ribose pyrophosphatase YjhB (NUDIX family)
MSFFSSLRKLVGRPAARLVVSVAILQGDRVVMVREGRAHKRGEWNLPAGRVDAAESILDAAIRETREESGLTIRLRSLGGIYIYTSRLGEDVVRFNFIAEALAGDLTADGDEILEVRWMTLDEVASIPGSQLRSAATLRQIISDLRAGRRYPLDTVREG